MPVVLVTQDGKQQIKFDRPILLIGRHPECDIVLTKSNKVSRKHCCLAMINDHFVVRDLGSTNGVRVNGREVAREARIELGEVLQIGDVNFLLQSVSRGSRKPRNSPGSQDQTVDKPSSQPEANRETIPPIDISQAYPVPIPEPDEDSRFDVQPGELNNKPEQPKQSRKHSNSDSQVEIVG